MCNMTLAVCINNMIFFVFQIPTKKSIIYALLYINATLTERIFSVGGLWMKKTNLCSCNNSSDFWPNVVMPKNEPLPKYLRKKKN